MMGYTQRMQRNPRTMLCLELLSEKQSWVTGLFRMC